MSQLPVKDVLVFTHYQINMVRTFHEVYESRGCFDVQYLKFDKIITAPINCLIEKNTLLTANEQVETLGREEITSCERRCVNVDFAVLGA